MGFLDNFKGKQYKQESDNLKAELERLRSTFTPEMQQADNLQQLINKLNSEIALLENDKNTKNQEITALNTTISGLNSQINSLKNEIVELNDEVLFQSFGLYQPRYSFANSDQYKDRLNAIRYEQKEAIKYGKAATGNMGWTVNGNAKQGTKMVKDTQKLLIRAFNTECDDVIDKVKFNNIDSAEKRITKAKDAISKLGTIMTIAITDYYYSLKIQELYLAYEYAQKVQEEKEEQKRIREELREQAKLEKEIEAERKKIAKEQTHYNNQLNTLNKQLENSNLSDEERTALEDKKVQIQDQLEELDKSLKNVDYRAANQKAGYVYIISNIGAFGENVYKIGMTRRLEPMDRVNELGDASVPFNFDVHAMIFSDNAPALESALHKAFENKKVNMINTRREFFNVTLEEIEAVVKANYDKTVEFVRLAPAEQYRETMKIKENTVS